MPPRHLLLPCLLLIPALAAAQPATASLPHPGTVPANARAAEHAALMHATHGPANIGLAGQAHLHIPADAAWIPPDAARMVLLSWGNNPGPDILGMVVGIRPMRSWWATVAYSHEGHFKEDQARDLNPADMLAQLRDANEHDNATRRSRGFLPVVIDGWLQPPVYDATTHRLVWALQVHDAGSSEADSDVNYRTRTLGRDGYVGVNLVTTSSHFAAEKPSVDALLTELTYDKGKRYQDFDPSKDHVAEYGMAGLIGVVIAQKLGMFAVATAFFLKFAKLGAVVFVAIVAGMRRLLRRSSTEAA